MCSQRDLYEPYIEMLVSLSYGERGAYECSKVVTGQTDVQELHPELTLMIPDYVQDKLHQVEELLSNRQTGQARPPPLWSKLRVVDGGGGMSPFGVAGGGKE